MVLYITFPLVASKIRQSSSKFLEKDVDENESYRAVTYAYFLYECVDFC